MRLVLPVLLLTTTMALAQPAPAKPYIDDRRTGLCEFAPPTPVIVTAAPDARGDAPRPTTITPVPGDISPAKPAITLQESCAKPEPPKPPVKGYG